VIEYLALAAEVTAVLLIISIAYPGVRRSHASANEAFVNDREAITDLEPFQSPLQTIRLLVHQTSSQHYLQQSSASDWLQSDSHLEITQSLKQLMTLATHPDHDALTHLPAIETLKTFFSNLRPSHRRLGFPMQIASLVVDGWAALIQHGGQVVADRVLRELAKELSDKLSPHGCVIRFSEYTFTVGFVGLPTPKVVELLDCIRQSINDNKLLIGEQEISTSVSIALSEILDSDFNTDDHLTENVWERLEESITQAITAGGNQIQGYTLSESDEKLPVDAQPLTSEAKTATSEGQASPEKPISSSIEANPASATVVSGDDIAALFAAQKKPKSKAVQSDVLTAVETTDAKPNKPIPPEVAVDSSATADDIASLFAANKKPALRPKLEPEPVDPVAVQELPPVSEESHEESTEESLVATIEDIQSLFADAQKKHEAKHTEKRSPSAPNAEGPQSKAIESIAEPQEAKNNAAGADDIEALFASMRK